jgi:hypothetical protein
MGPIMRSTITATISVLVLLLYGGIATGDEMPQCYDPRPPTCTARIAPCWGDYTTVTEACKRSRSCSLSLIARVTADWNRVLATCTHTGMP